VLGTILKEVYPSTAYGHGREKCGTGLPLFGHSHWELLQEILFQNLLIWGTGERCVFALVLLWRRLLVGSLGNFFFPEKLWIAILTFWIVYITTRPVGASIGDLLTAPSSTSYDDTQCFFSGTDLSISNVTNLNVTSFNFDIVAGNYSPGVFVNFTEYILNFGVGSQSIDCTGADMCTVTVDCPDSGSNCPAYFETCVNNLACDQCWGLGAVVTTNITFSVIVVVLVTFLTITQIDLTSMLNNPDDGLVMRWFKRVTTGTIRERTFETEDIDLDRV